MRYIRQTLAALLMLSAANVFAFTPQGGKPQPAAPTSWAEKTLAAMTLDEKIGQLIIPAVIGQFIGQDTEAFQKIRRDITEFHAGGYHILGDVTMLHEPAGVALLTNHMQEMAKVPLLITADFEGGVGYRFRGATRLPRAMAIGATGSEDLAYQAGRVAAAEARAVGVNVNFYPVVDVNNNPRNPIINIRSFGGDPRTVSRLARAYIRGLQSANVMATAKHFPGHGDTSADSHLELPSVDADRARLNQIELPPFRAAVEEGVGGVMSAHIALPRLETSGVPATLSSMMLTDVLRGELKFQGIIFTDALDMRGVTAHYPEAEAAVRALKAGADVLLLPPDVEKAFMGVKRAVESGDVPLARVEASVRRILAAKAKLGLDKNRLVDLNQLDRVLGSAEHRRAADQILENAITLVRDERHVLPLKLRPEQKALCITLMDNAGDWRDGVPGRAFQAGLTERHPQTTGVAVSDKTAPAEFDLIKKLAALSDVVVVNAFVRVAAYKGSIDLTEGQLDLLKHLSAMKKPFVFVLYGSPYLLTFVPELPTYILGYEYYPAVEMAVLRAVVGETEFKGRLPIELPGLYPVGHSAAKPRATQGGQQR